MTRDSMGRADTDAALRENERFRSLANAAPVMLWVSEPDGECSFLSQAWHDFTGTEEKNGLGAGWLESVHGDDRTSIEASFASARDKKTPFSIEYRLRRHDGAYRWVIDSGRPRFGADGVLLGFVGVVIDNTERKQKELELRRSGEQLELLSDTVPALISYVGTDRRYRTCNALYSKWFGLPREKIVGHTMEEVLGTAAWRIIGPHVEKAL